MPVWSDKSFICCSNSSSGTPVSFDVSAIVLNFAILSSNSLAAATLAVPTAVIAAVTGNIFCPADVALSPIVPNALPTFSSVILLLLAAVSRFFNSSSVAATSLLIALYCSADASPFLNCCSTWASAVFNTSNLSFVSPTAFVSNCCFCAKSSVFLGSNFKPFSTSFNSSFVVLTALFTLDNAFCSFSVLPSISIVIPLMLLAT